MNAIMTTADGINVLEARLAALEDVEALRKLKADYWWTVDNKLWHELRNLLADDFVLYSEGQVVLEGADRFVAFVSDRLGADSSVHLGHTPRIDLNTATTAKGRWVFNDDIVAADGSIRRGFGHYLDDYVKGDNGRWAIKAMQVSYARWCRITGSKLGLV